jgi:DNA-binding CsgD family transcriptional regulator
VSYIQKIEDWRASVSIGAVYERMLCASGADDFGAVVRDAVLSTTAGARRVYLFEATGRDESALQYVFCEPSLVELLPAYNRSYHRIDPVCDAYRAAPRAGDVAVQRVRPADIASSGFRQQFFDRPGIVERVSVIQRGGAAWRVINVARHASDGLCSDQEMEAIVGLACLALPMLPLNRRTGAPGAPLSVEQFERRFGDFLPELSERERQVCARAAVGMTVEATALDLGVAKTTVLTYRQRAYQRLGVTSPFELCALVAR